MAKLQDRKQSRRQRRLDRARKAYFAARHTHAKAERAYQKARARYLDMAFADGLDSYGGTD